MTPETTLALVGKGRWGQNYIKTIKNLESCCLAKKHIRTRDYPTLFKHHDIDGVIIATPMNTHFNIAKDFLVRDFHLLIEKPVTKTYQEALELQKTHAKHKNVIISVGHIQLYDPAYAEIKRQVGKVGRIQKINFKGLQSPARKNSTVLEDWGPHPIYLFMDLLEKEPITVSAKHTSADNIHLALEFEGQIPTTADIGWTSSERKREFSVTGSSGTILLDYSGRAKKLVFIDNKNEEKSLDFLATQSLLELEILEFIKCIKDKRQPKTPLSQGVQVMKIIHLAKESLKQDEKTIKNN